MGTRLHCVFERWAEEGDWCWGHCKGQRDMWYFLVCPIKMATYLYSHIFPFWELVSFFLACSFWSLLWLVYFFLHLHWLMFITVTSYVYSKSRTKHISWWSCASANSLVKSLHSQWRASESQATVYGKRKRKCKNGSKKKETDGKKSKNIPHCSFSFIHSIKGSLQQWQTDVCALKMLSWRISIWSIFLSACENEKYSIFFALQY